MTDIDNTDNLHTLMRAQISREFELAHAVWITDRDPPRMGTYLTSCVNGDGHAYCACHYWNEIWASPGPFVTVNGWQELPLPLITKLDKNTALRGEKV